MLTKIKNFIAPKLEAKITDIERQIEQANVALAVATEAFNKLSLESLEADADQNVLAQASQEVKRHKEKLRVLEAALSHATSQKGATEIKQKRLKEEAGKKQRADALINLDQVGREVDDVLEDLERVAGKLMDAVEKVAGTPGKSLHHEIGDARLWFKECALWRIRNVAAFSNLAIVKDPSNATFSKHLPKHMKGE